MFKKKILVSSGVRQLDRQLGDRFIGDNVVWYDSAGSLASIFSLNFIQESQRLNKPLNYIVVDQSPKTLFEDLGPLAENQHLTILKADKRRPDALNRPLVYWNDGPDVVCESETGKGGNIDLGGRVKQIRNHQSMPQKESASSGGVTPSTISQIESGTIYPSLLTQWKNTGKGAAKLLFWVKIKK